MTYTNRAMLAIAEMQTILNTQSYSNGVAIKTTIGYNSDNPLNSLALEPVRCDNTGDSMELTLRLFLSASAGSIENRINDMMTNDETIRNSLIRDKDDAYTSINSIEYVSTEYMVADGSLEYALSITLKIKLYK